MIYTIGYSYHRPEELQRLAKAHRAFVIDVRLQARSKRPEWCFQRLQELIGKYLHLPELGNVNYNNGGPIELKDPVFGIDFISRMANGRNLILFCGCAKRETCHRAEIAEMLEMIGLEVQELEWPVNGLENQ